MAKSVYNLCKSLTQPLNSNKKNKLNRNPKLPKFVNNEIDRLAVWEKFCEYQMPNHHLHNVILAKIIDSLTGYTQSLECKQKQKQTSRN